MDMFGSSIPWTCAHDNSHLNPSELMCTLSRYCPNLEDTLRGRFLGKVLRMKSFANTGQKFCTIAGSG